MMTTRQSCHLVVVDQLVRDCTDLRDEIKKGVGAPYTIRQAVIAQLVDALSQSDIPNEDLNQVIASVNLSIQTLQQLAKVPFSLDRLLGELLINLQSRTPTRPR